MPCRYIIASVQMTALVLSACTPEPRDAGATLRYRSHEFMLHVPNGCGANDDGTFDTWAVTLDANGNVAPDQPHLRAMGRNGWSAIDIYPGEGDRILRVYRVGTDRFSFADGRLSFSGITQPEPGIDVADYVEVEIACP